MNQTLVSLVPMFFLAGEPERLRGRIYGVSVHDEAGGARVHVASLARLRLPAAATCVALPPIANPPLTRARPPTTLA